MCIIIFGVSLISQLALLKRSCKSAVFDCFKFLASASFLIASRVSFLQGNLIAPIVHCFSQSVQKITQLLGFLTTGLFFSSFSSNSNKPSLQ